jgi:histidine triad (HIT) family protein
MDCIFCKIVNKEIKSEIIYETENIVAFNDLNPQAPYHILIIPKKHIETINDVEPENMELIGELVIAAKKIAKQKNIADSGYRLIFNCNKDAGQEVFHIHLHLLGGRKFSWPPG